MSLPKGFKRLEYIQSSGSEYINTAFKPNNNTKLVAELQFVSAPSTTSNSFLLGARSSSSSGRFSLFYGGSANGGWGFGYNTTLNAVTTTVDPTSKTTAVINKNVCTVGGQSVTASATTFNTTQNLTLFAENNSGTVGQGSAIKLYSCQIYENGTLVRDFIPCQNASGAVGLWDAVNAVFYGNAGTGAFTAGPVVPEQVDESEITELEYIQSSGTQYVKTNFYPNNNTRVLMDFAFAGAYSGNIGLCGARTSSDSKTYCFWFYTDYITSCRFDFASNNDKGTEVKLPSGERLTLDMNQNTCMCGNFSQTKTDADFQCEYDLSLFGINTTGTVGVLFTGQLYAGQIFNNGLLERDYIPAMLPNGEVGLYDRVFHEFYRNAGTGEFIAGPEAQTVPKAPSNFRVESETDTLVTLAWDASEDAVGYRLYRQGQLLADITETSVSVEVEPFAGAVFTLTAYNENGEGPGSTLTYYNIPDNPLLYLITDRTQKDVAERNPKGYYAASDLNRVGYAIDYLAPIIRGYGYTLEVHTKTDWTDEDWKLTGEMVQYLQSLNNLKSVFYTLVELPETMEKINYADANNIEQLLLTIDETVVRVVAGFTRTNAFGLRSGAKGLPVSQSDRGRNWGQLDAMETTWANWQLSTWYLLLYGNLKAEGVVE